MYTFGSALADTIFRDALYATLAFAIILIGIVLTRR